MLLFALVHFIFRALVAILVAYCGFLLLLSIPFFQVQAIYLHRITLTWFQDVNDPTQWGFLPNQVTPFCLRTSDGETLHAWHILPIGRYQRYREALAKEPLGLASDIEKSYAFKLLRDQPDSLLVLYLHGAAGTLGSGWRPQSYRAMHALGPENIHTVAIDYRGFGTSSGSPSEAGLLSDALALVNWAMHTANIPPERIVVFGQSIGTAVGISLLHHLATKPENPIFFRGAVLVAPFADVDQLTSTYRIAGTIPLLSPLSYFPTLYSFFKTLLVCKWPSQVKLAEFVQSVSNRRKARYDITIIHAKDDWDIPWSHSETLFRYVANATVDNHEASEQYLRLAEDKRERLGPGGWSLAVKSPQGVLRQEIVQHGLHDRIMSYPIVSLAIWRAFQSEISAEVG